jgi:hypothetical protein
MACECHNLNFGNHWKILTDHVKPFTLKRLRVTCWEAKISSVKVLRYTIVDVHITIITLAEREKRYVPDIAHEAVTLSQQLNTSIFFFFSFISRLLQCAVPN